MLGVAIRTLDDVHRLAGREVARGLSHLFAAMHTDAFVAVLAVAVRTIPCQWSVNRTYLWDRSAR